MKKITFIIITTLVLFYSGNGHAEEMDFRNTKWGMTMEEVIKSEGKEPTVAKNDKTATYKGTIAGLDNSYSYTFIDNKLTSAAIIFTGLHTNKNDYIDDFNRVKKMLIHKYGKPENDVQKWKNDLFRDHREGWGIAISVGDLEYIALWKMDRTDVFLQLTGENYEILFGILYQSKQLKDLQEKESEKEILDKL